MNSKEFFTTIIKRFKHRRKKNSEKLKTMQFQYGQQDPIDLLSDSFLFIKCYTTLMNIRALTALGTILRNAREKKQLTQVQVAEKTDMTVNYYAMIERGEANLSFDKLRKLTKLLKVNPSELPL